jgi:hypothetical protein
MTNIITNDFYDNRTYNMLYQRLTEDDMNFIKSSDDTIENMLFTRWCTIISSIMPNYYSEYSNQTTQQLRNDWFQKYLEYPTKDMSLMPESLL